MAVDVYSENTVDIIRPTRFSFSHDLKQDANLINKNTRLDHNLLDSTPFDFAFDLNSTTFFQSSLSTADELFSNGKILPTQIKKQESPEKLTLCSEKKSLREFLEDSIEEKETNISSTKSFWKFRRNNSEKKRVIGSSIVDEDEETEEPTINVKSFWKFGRSNSLNSAPIANCNAKKVQFRRSNSLNCTISGANRGLTGPVNHLSRSKSAPNQVRKSNQKGQIGNMKIYGYGNGNGNCNSMRVSPILNLPCPYISRLRVDLFGFGSLFCNGSRDRKKKK